MRLRAVLPLAVLVAATQCVCVSSRTLTRVDTSHASASADSERPAPGADVSRWVAWVREACCYCIGA